MTNIKNLLNSPYEIVLADGTKDILPARGSLEGVDIHPMHMPLYRAIGYFEITDGEITEGKASAKPDPLDHDEDGKKGGSKPAAESDDGLKELRDQYKELTGKKPHHLWKEDRLQAEIDKALDA